MYPRIVRVLLAALLVFLAACRLIPIQNARVSQVEFYKQYFDVEPSPAACVADEIHPDCERRRLEAATDQLFIDLIGEANWRLLKGMHSLANIRKELRDHEVYIQGLLNFSAYLDPMNHGRLWVEGTGRYFLMREKTQEILLYGDFYIPLEKHPVADLDNGTMTLGVRLFITLPGETAVFQKSKVRYRVHFDTRAKAHKVYALDYGKAHEVFLDASGTGSGPVIGHLYFEQPPTPVKLLDLRMIDWLRDDYAAIFQDSDP